MEDFLRSTHLARHQEAEAIKLWEVLFCVRHAKKISAFYAPRLDRQGRFARRTMAILRQLDQTAPDFLGIGATVEGGNPEITLALRAKSASRRDDNIQFVQHAIEHLPARYTLRRCRPDVGRVGATKDLQTGRGSSFAQNLRVAHVVIDQRLRLLAPF